MCLADQGEALRALGADVVVDVSTTRLEDVAHDVDVVLDTIGPKVHEASFAVLKPSGILVSSVSEPAPRAIRSKFMLVDVTTAVLDRIADNLATGALRTNIGCLLPLTDITIAHEMLDGLRPRPTGKIILSL